MKNTRPLRYSRIAAVCSFALISGCATFDNVKGNLKVDYLDAHEEGLEDLSRAMTKSPTDANFKVDYLLKRDQAIRKLLLEADGFRDDGKLEEARSVYEKVLKLDGSQPRAISGLLGLKQDARYLRLLDDGENYLEKSRFDLAMDRANQVLEDFPRNKRALKLRDAAADAKTEHEADKARDRASKTILDSMVTLQFSDASLKLVFESLARSTGLNVLFDRDVKQDAKSTIFVKDVSVSDAVDLILLQNQLRKRVVNGNTLMIYPASNAKQDEYEDLVIKTFQITNADVKYLASMLKSMLKVRELSADEKTGIMVLRDTPENLRLAERLIAAHDIADPEIMLEVEVLEVSDARDSNLGIKPPNSVTLSTPGTGNSMTLGALQRLSRDDLLVSSLSTTLNFKLEDSEAKILASPRIRARNKEPAKIMIGDRVPTITNTVTPVNTGSSVVTGNVTYQDVGLKLEFEPQVYSNSEVGIKISLEVSSIAKEFTDANGGRSYQIGTRNAATNLRLKDGETQILGGLITDEDRNAASKIPGLGHLPLIGRIFGNNSGTSNRSEIVLAITPRIVRNLAVRTPEVRSIFSGTYNTVRERPILADPVGQLKVGGTFGGSGSTSVGPSSNNSNAGGLLINSAPASSSSLGNRTNTFGTNSTTVNPGQNSTLPAPLPLPPPMFKK